MKAQDLYDRYGLLVSQRVAHELTPSEFDQVTVDVLPSWLENRAEAAHDTYRALLTNPPSCAQTDPSRRVGEACRRWREAEDLAYLVVIADDVSANVKAQRAV